MNLLKPLLDIKFIRIQARCVDRLERMNITRDPWGIKIQMHRALIVDQVRKLDALVLKFEREYPILSEIAATYYLI